MKAIVQGRSAKAILVESGRKSRLDIFVVDMAEIILLDFGCARAPTGRGLLGTHFTVVFYPDDKRKDLWVLTLATMNLYCSAFCISSVGLPWRSSSIAPHLVDLGQE